ncbi:MAG: hypothetical protein ABJB66_12215 [Gemmatimonadaceae bacterium]
MLSFVEIARESKLTIGAAVLAMAFTAFAAPRVAEVEANSSVVSTVNGVTVIDHHRFTGHLLEHFASGQIKRDASYEHGVLSGITRGWYANGTLAYVREYSTGHADGKHRGWYASGKRKFIYNLRDGMSEGVEQQWYESGQPYTRFRYEHGQEQGQQQMWNADGALRANYVIKDGRRYGLPGSLGCRGEDLKREGGPQEKFNEK